MYAFRYRREFAIRRNSFHQYGIRLRVKLHKSSKDDFNPSHISEQFFMLRILLRQNICLFYPTLFLSISLSLSSSLDSIWYGIIEIIKGEWTIIWIYLTLEWGYKLSMIISHSRIIFRSLHTSGKKILKEEQSESERGKQLVRVR